MAKSIRCAVYTRKSTEEGLEQAFNSLDAQREACGAYVLSQQHEGWNLLPEIYDDGGYSGGNMDRPALRQLLEDVRAGKVDVIVVYKVDRLTRSLADFAKIVEVLDATGACFVSVTQAFNTTTSMGRLTLNVLLSFAQFEREVTGERIRDKVAASKAKGMWMGGIVPLGYDVIDKRLVINNAEAATVRMIFDRYLGLGSITSLAAELAAAGIRSKVRRLASGEQYGDRRFTKGALAHLLQNPTYIGQVRHKGICHAGMHEGIIARETWDAAQAMFADHRRVHVLAERAEHPSVLAGMMQDGEGRPMTPVHSNKGTRRYRYYVSRIEPGVASETHPQAWRLPAGDLEQLVTSRISQLFLDPKELALDTSNLSAEHLYKLHQRAADLARGGISREVLLRLRLRVEVREHEIGIALSLAAVLGTDASNSERSLVIPATLKRRGGELRLVLSPKDAAAPTRRDPRLIALLSKANAAIESLQNGLAPPEKNERMHLMRLGRLTFLAPDIVDAIVTGRQPPQLTARRLLRASYIPLDWREQRQVLGFAPADRPDCN